MKKFYFLIYIIKYTFGSIKHPTGDNTSIGSKMEFLGVTHWNRVSWQVCFIDKWYLKWSIFWLSVIFVGMSTVAEAIVGRHMGMKVFGISLITDKCCLDYNTARVTTHEEVLAIGQKRAGDLQSLVLKILELMH